MKRFWWFLALMVFIFPTFWSLIRPGIHNIQDNMQYFRVFQMSKCFEDGQIPCRWVPDMGYGFGYPLYIYYSPGPYYLGLFIHYLGFQYIDSIKILFISGFLVSALGMMALGITMFRSLPISFLISILYLYLPVRAVQVYVRGSLGEFLAMAIFPFLFLYAYRLINNIGKNNTILFGLALFSLLMTHNLMTIAFGPVLVGWIIYLLWKKQNFQNVGKLVIGIAIGLGLASFYVMPLIFERGYVNLESMTGGYFDYRQHFVSIKQLFWDNRFGYGSSVLGINDDLSLSVGILHWILALGSVILTIYYYKNKKKIDFDVIVLAIFTLSYLFLTHEKSAVVWNSVEFLKMFQFPWRFLVIIGFLMSLMAGYFIKKFNKKWLNASLVLIPLLLNILYVNFFIPQRWMPINDSYLLTGKELEKQLTASIFDYLPKSAVLPPNYKAPSLPEILTGKVIIDNYQKYSDRQEGKLIVLSETARIRLPIFDFPGMVVTDNDRPIVFDHKDCRNQDYCFGQISFELDKGFHQIAVELKSTPIRRIGDILTISALMLVGYKIFLKKSYE